MVVVRHQPVVGSSGRKSLTRAHPLGRERARLASPERSDRPDRTHGQCHLTWKDCFGCPTASLLEDEIPKPPNAGRVTTPTRAGPKTSRVSLSSRCQLPRSRDRTGRRTAMRLPIRSSASRGLVGREGVEPSTSRLSGVRSNHLSYRPNPVGSVDPFRGFCGFAAKGAGGACRPKGRHQRTRWAEPGEAGGAYRDRTGDLMLAKHALSQLS
jgi:hypothetical protein